MRRKRKVVVKQVVKYVEKPAAKPAAVVAKYVDGQGRQFDLDQQGVVRRQEPVLAGRQGVRLQERLVVLRRRALDRDRAPAGACRPARLPQQVSCDGIKAFSAKIEQAQAKPAKSVVEPKVEKVEQAELKTEPVEKPAKVATVEP